MRAIHFLGEREGGLPGQAGRILELVFRSGPQKNETPEIAFRGFAFSRGNLQANTP
jgi:hypothetical protein